MSPNILSRIWNDANDSEASFRLFCLKLQLFPGYESSGSTLPSTTGYLQDIRYVQPLKILCRSFFASVQQGWGRTACLRPQNGSLGSWSTWSPSCCCAACIERPERWGSTGQCSRWKVLSRWVLMQSLIISPSWNLFRELEPCTGIGERLILFVWNLWSSRTFFDDFFKKRNASIKTYSISVSRKV